MQQPFSLTGVSSPAALDKARQGSSDQRPADDPSHYGRPKRLSTTTPQAGCARREGRRGVHCAEGLEFGGSERASDGGREGERDSGAILARCRRRPYFAPHRSRPLYVTKSSRLFTVPGIGTALPRSEL
ncbi:unnamed protein product [Sphagnum troendelagicum]|uniref:Uncharacterized protein n=1 Tax=Sphagnum troendelagicum TaxID=128251 RepID=A0ABP0TLX3_9BRYO